jgi:hypothetical protein
LAADTFQALLVGYEGSFMKIVMATVAARVKAPSAMRTSMVCSRSVVSVVNVKSLRVQVGSDASSRISQSGTKLNCDLPNGFGFDAALLRLS